MINMIVAYDQMRGIGKAGDLLWRPGEMREDMRQFRELTRNTTVIMGRKTLESIGVALPKRRNIVVTHDPKFKPDGIEAAQSVDEAFRMSGDNEIFVIGGSQIYSAALDRTKRVYATEIQATIPGADAFFPALNEEWSEVSRTEHLADAHNLYDYDFVTYERNRNSEDG